MLRALILGLAFSAGTLIAQTAGPSLPNAQDFSSPPPPLPSSSLAETPQPASAADLPDAPSEVQVHLENVVVVGQSALKESGKDQASCNFLRALGRIYVDPGKINEGRPRCSELVYPYQRFLSTNIAIPLNWKQKGYLAAHYSSDLATLGTIVGISAINIAVDSHTAYGPGLKGFGKLAGISLLQNATAEAFGTFAIPAITHQDPRYYRMPGKPFGKRVLYSISRSYVSRNDAGKTIPNYGVLGSYPIVAELSNLYVPGIQSDGASTAERILTGYALDPVNNLVNEFLPDVAKHIHVRVIFVQQILNNIAVAQGSMP